jgi:hypothetical protein
METPMERWYKATQARFSVRAYTSDPTEAQFAALRQAASQLSARGVRIDVMRDERVFTGLFGKKINGTNTFAAILSRGARPETAGYIGEAFVLECTSMGLHTCWLGASFSKQGVSKAIRLHEGEKLVCIVSIGQSAEKYVARKRGTIAELTEINDEQFARLPEWKRCAVECARMAPSATNAQPWSFDTSGAGIGVENVSWNFGWGRLDCGIAMLHVELGAAHCGVGGEWKEGKDMNTFLPVGRT